MRDRPLQRSVNLSFQPLAEQEGFHVIYQKLLMLRVYSAQAVMVYQLVLGSQPAFPAALTNLFVNPLAERVAEWRFLQARQFLPAAGALNDFSHLSSSCDSNLIEFLLSGKADGATRR
jgi:hypothetical protein